jgi:hypothetical protein
MGMRAFHVVVALLVSSACKRTVAPEPTPVASASASTNPAPLAKAATPAASSAPAPATSSSATPDAGLPDIEALKVKSCPAPIARVKVPEGRVEIIGCPDEMGDDIQRNTETSRIVLVDSAGKTKSEGKLADSGEQASVSLELYDLYGDGRPVFFVTVTVPTMGSWNGPTTTLYEIDGGKLRGVSGFSLVSSINNTWWVSPARSGRGKDVYQIRTNREGESNGTRYAFEQGRWVARSSRLQNWTGEHLSNTDAEFK